MTSAWLILLIFLIGYILGVVVTEWIGYSSYKQGYSEGIDDAEILCDWSKGIEND